MQKGLDIYEKRFCAALKDWFENEFKPGKKGAVSKCAALLKVSQGHLSMILKGEKCWRSEAERRAIAKKIGRTYEEMIGQDPREKEAPAVHEAPVAYKLQPGKSAGEITTLLEMTREVLESPTDYSESLAANVRSFHNAIQTQKRLGRLEAKVAELQQTIEAILHTDRRKGERRQQEIAVREDNRSAIERRRRV